MIRHADLPVLIIKASITDFKIRTVVFVTTLEEREQEALALLDQVTYPWNAVIHLLYVSKPLTSEETNVSLRKIEQLTKGLKTPVEFSICNEKVEIKKVAVDLDADLVVLTTHGKNSLARAVSSGLAEKFAGEYQRPVLVINTK